MLSFFRHSIEILLFFLLARPLPSLCQIDTSPRSRLNLSKREQGAGLRSSPLPLPDSSIVPVISEVSEYNSFTHDGEQYSIVDPNCQQLQCASFIGKPNKQELKDNQNIAKRTLNELTEDFDAELLVAWRGPETPWAPIQEPPLQFTERWLREISESLDGRRFSFYRAVSNYSNTAAPDSELFDFAHQDWPEEKRPSKGMWARQVGKHLVINIEYILSPYLLYWVLRHEFSRKDPRRAATFDHGWNLIVNDPETRHGIYASLNDPVHNTIDLDPRLAYLRDSFLIEILSWATPSRAHDSDINRQSRRQDFDRAPGPSYLSLEPDTRRIEISDAEIRNWVRSFDWVTFGMSRGEADSLFKILRATYTQFQRARESVKGDLEKGERGLLKADGERERDTRQWLLYFAHFPMPPLRTTYRRALVVLAIALDTRSTSWREPSFDEYLQRSALLAIAMLPSTEGLRPHLDSIFENPHEDSIEPGENHVGSDTLPPSRGTRPRLNPILENANDEDFIETDSVGDAIDPEDAERKQVQRDLDPD